MGRTDGQTYGPTDRRTGRTGAILNAHPLFFEKVGSFFLFLHETLDSNISISTRDIFKLSKNTISCMLMGKYSEPWL